MTRLRLGQILKFGKNPKMVLIMNRFLPKDIPRCSCSLCFVNKNLKSVIIKKQWLEKLGGLRESESE